jgi:hypothetical protein
MDIVLCFQTDDVEFERLIKNEFGNNVDFVLTSDLDGKQFFSVAIKFGKTLIAFLKKYVDSSETKRFIRTKSGDLYFQNYTADEIVKILEALNAE